MCAMCMPAFLLPASRVYKRGRILAIGWAAYERVSCKMCLQSWTCHQPQCLFKESACKPVLAMSTSIIISLCADCQCLLQALTCTRQNSVWLALTIACLHLPVDVVLTMPSHSLLVLASVSCESSLLRYSIYCLPLFAFTSSCTACPNLAWPKPACACQCLLQVSSRVVDRGRGIFLPSNTSSDPWTNG